MGVKVPAKVLVKVLRKDIRLLFIEKPKQGKDRYHEAEKGVAASPLESMHMQLSVLEDFFQMMPD